MHLRVITLKKTFKKKKKKFDKPTDRQISCDSMTAVFNKKASVVGVASVSQGQKLILHKQFTYLLTSLI